MAVHDANVPKGMAEAMKQAEAGMALFKEKGEVKVDRPAAESFKAAHEALLFEIQKVIDGLSGKDHKKERTAKSKELADLKVDKQYIDACKITKGLEPVNGHFVVDSGEPAAEASAADAPVTEQPKASPDAKKAPRPAKKAESAGLSPAEKKELDQLKNDIVARKTKLKEEGVSGGQQNKDPQIVEWVARMNQLKEKESPGSTAKPDKKEEGKKKKVLGSQAQKEADQLRKEIEEYKNRLRTEFGYTNKDIKADPELAEMEARLTGIEKSC
jgi:hypothetical protein